jgi:hypothetical protein
MNGQADGTPSEPGSGSAKRQANRQVDDLGSEKGVPSGRQADSSPTGSSSRSSSSERSRRRSRSGGRHRSSRSSSVDRRRSRRSRRREHSRERRERSRDRRHRSRERRDYSRHRRDRRGRSRSRDYYYRERRRPHSPSRSRRSSYGNSRSSLRSRQSEAGYLHPPPPLYGETTRYPIAPPHQVEVSALERKVDGLCEIVRTLATGSAARGSTSSVAAPAPSSKASARPSRLVTTTSGGAGENASQRLEVPSSPAHPTMVSHDQRSAPLAGPASDRVSDWVDRTIDTPGVPFPSDILSRYENMFRAAEYCHSYVKDTVPLPKVDEFVHPLLEDTSSVKGRAPLSLSHLSSQKRAVLDRLDEAVAVLPFKPMSRCKRSSLALQKNFTSHGENIAPRAELDVKHEFLPLPEAAHDESRSLGLLQQSLMELNSRIQHQAVLIKGFRHSLPSPLSEDSQALFDCLAASSVNSEALISLTLGNLRLRERELRLSAAQIAQSTKDFLWQLPLFQKELFPTELKTVQEQENTSASVAKLSSLVQQSLTSSKSNKPQASKPKQTNAQHQQQQRSSAVRGRGRGGKSGSGRPSNRGRNLAPKNNQSFRRDNNPPKKD